MAHTADALRFENQDGLQACAVAELMVFFDDAAAEDSALTEVYGWCWAALAPHLTTLRTDSVVAPRPVQPWCEDLVRHWCRTLPADRRGRYIELASGPSEDSIGPWTLRLHLPGQFGRKGAAALRATWPVAWAAAQPERMARAFEAICERLPGAWGTAGYGIEYDTRRIDRDRDQVLRGWCGRYLGLILRDFDDMLWTDSPSLMSASWITRVPEDLRPLVPDAAPVRVGESPTIGDSNRQDDVASLAVLQNRLRPFIATPAQLPSAWSEEDFLAWLGRFEKRS